MYDGVPITMPVRDVVVGRRCMKRDAPVEDVRLAEVTEHDVVGLEIAVDDAARVREQPGQIWRDAPRCRLPRAFAIRSLSGMPSR
jgi:hypothetical protein